MASSLTGWNRSPYAELGGADRNIDLTLSLRFLRKTCVSRLLRHSHLDIGVSNRPIPLRRWFSGIQSDVVFW